MRIVEQIVQRVERHHGNVRVSQRRQPLRGGARRQLARDPRIRFIKMLRAIGMRVEALVAFKLVFAAQQPEKSAPLFVVVNQQAQIAVACFVRIAVLGEQARIAHRCTRRIKGAAAHVIAQDKLRESFKHRDFNRLPFAAALAVKQRGEDGMHRIQPGDAIGER